MGSKHPYGISGPLKTSLSKPKRICPHPYATKVNVNPQMSNVVVQLCHPCPPHNLVTRFCKQTDVVRSFLAPNRKLKHQVLSASRNFQRRLTSFSLGLPASHRSFTKIQDGCVRRVHRVSGSHPQPSPHGEEQNSSTGHRPSQDASALDHRLPTKLLKF